MQVFLLLKCITFGEDEKWPWEVRECSDKGYSYKMRNKREKNSIKKTTAMICPKKGTCFYTPEIHVY